MYFNLSFCCRVLLGLFCFSTASALAQPGSHIKNTAFLTWHDDPTTTMVAQWLVLESLPEAMPGSSDDAAFATPRLPKPITVDGHGEDWGDHGLRLDYLPQFTGHWPDLTGMAATAKLGWTPEGFAVLINVIDDQATEDPNDELIWMGDSVELFLGHALDHPDAIQIVVAPGIDPATPDVRIKSFDRSHSRKPQPITFDVATAKTDEGYTVELFVPWGNLIRDGDALGIDDTLTCQLIVNDRDGSSDRVLLSWYPAADSFQNRQSMHTLRLAKQTDTTVRVKASPRLDTRLKQVVLDLGGEPKLIGERVVIRSGSIELATVLLENVKGFAGAVAVLPTDEHGVVPRTDAISIHLGDRIVGRTPLDLDAWRTMPKSVEVQILSNDDNALLAFESQVVSFGKYGMFLQRVSMTGLTPDSEYLLELPGQDDTLLFRTAPATLDRPLVFAEGGDVGTDPVVGDLHDIAATWNPLFGLVGGDCAYANGSHRELWIDFLRQWHNHMVTPTGHAIPLLATIGNHEVAGAYGKTREQAPFFDALFGPLYPNIGAYQALDFGDYLSLILLDSGHTAKHDGEQTTWLTQALDERVNVPYRFAAYHVPAYPSNRPYKIPNSQAARKHWVPLFEKHRITAAFEHHDHTYKRTHRLLGDEPHAEGVLYVGDGAWGRPARKANANLPYLAVAKTSLNVIRVELSPDGETSYLAVDEKGQTLDRYSQPLHSKE